MAIDVTVYPYFSPRIVVIDEPQTEATVQDLIDAIRDWEDGPYGEYHDYLIDAAGKVILRAAALEEGVAEAVERQLRPRGRQP